MHPRGLILTQYGWPSLNVEMLMLYVSDVAVARFLCILMLILAHYFYSSKLNIEMVRVMMPDYTSALRKLSCWAILTIGYLDLDELRVVLSHIVTLKSYVRVSYAILITNCS